MSEVKFLEEIKKDWPKDAPEIDSVEKYFKKYKDELIVIKYGGNVLIDRSFFNNFIEDISILNKLGLSIVIVHGGGPRIKRELDKVNITSKFIDCISVFKYRRPFSDAEFNAEPNGMVYPTSEMRADKDICKKRREKKGK